MRNTLRFQQNMSETKTDTATANASKWAPNPKQQPNEIKLKATPDSGEARLFLSLQHDVLVIRNVADGSIATFDIPVETLTVTRKKRMHVWHLAALGLGIICWFAAAVLVGCRLSAEGKSNLLVWIGFFGTLALLMPLFFLMRVRRPVVVFQFAMKDATSLQEVNFKCWLPSNKKKRAKVEKLLSDIELARQKTTGKLESAIINADDMPGNIILSMGGSIVFVVVVLSASVESLWFLLLLLPHAVALYGFLRQLKRRNEFAEFNRHAKKYRWEEALAWAQAYEAEDPARRGDTAFEQIEALTKMNRHGDALKCLESYQDVFFTETFTIIRDDLRLRMHLRMRKETGISTSVWF